MTSGNLDSSRKNFAFTEMLCLCSKTYCCNDSCSLKFKFSSKGLNKRTLESSGDGPMSNYRNVLGETVNVTSTNHGFCTIDHVVSTYEQTEKHSLLFLPSVLFRTMEFTLTRPLTVYSFQDTFVLGLYIILFFYLKIIFCPQHSSQVISSQPLWRIKFSGGG